MLPISGRPFGKSRAGKTLLRKAKVGLRAGKNAAGKNRIIL